MKDTKPKPQVKTGIMNRLRDKMVIIIVIVVIAFLGTIIFDWGMNYLGMNRGSITEMGAVNGEEITFKEFDNLYQQQIEQLREQNKGRDIDDAKADELKEQIWNTLVTEKLLDQEINRLGLKVTDQEILDWVYNRPEQLPDQIKRFFIDSTGQFNYDFYRQALTMKEKEVKLFWNQVEQLLKTYLVRDKLQSVLMSSYIVSDGELLQKFKDDYIKAGFDYVLLDLNSVIDTTLNNVSEEEMRKYYDEHKDEFKQEEVVRFKYVIFSDAQTADDTAYVKNILTKEIDILKTLTVEDSSLIREVNVSSSVPFNGEFQKLNTISNNVAAFLFKAEKDDVSDVIIDPDGYKVIKFLDKKDGEESFFEAAQVLFRVDADSVSAKKKANDVIARLRKGENVNELAVQLSEDESAKQNSGNLGWITKGKLTGEYSEIENAIMKGKAGDVIGPVRTSFGYHVIKIKQKSNTEFKFAEVRMEVKTTVKTREQVKKKAFDFYSDIERGLNIDSVAKKLNVVVQTTNDIPKESFIPGAGQNKNLLDFAFQNPVNSVYVPVKVTGGLGVYQIVGKIPEGYKNYDSIKMVMVKPKVIIQKKYAVLQQIANDLKSKIQNNDINSLKIIAPNYVYGTVDSMTFIKPNPQIGSDFAVNNAVFYNTGIGQVSEPIKGARGYYIIKLNSLSPFNEQEFLAKYKDIRSPLVQERSQYAYRDWFNYQMKNAKIVDNRDKLQFY